MRLPMIQALVKCRGNAHRVPCRLLVLLLPCFLLAEAVKLQAEDWPQWLGPQRDGIWRESGTLERFTTNGPPRLWSVPVRPSYVGPAVAGGRLFLLDRKAEKPPERKKGEPGLPHVPGQERVLCLDPKSGQTLWEHVYNCPYRISYPSGPRATPVVSGQRVFTLGAMGDLKCLNVADGTVLWSVALPSQYACDPPVWGYAAHPLLDGNRLIVPVGGTNSALVALEIQTGRELWRALTAHEIGYAPPILQEIAGRRQIVFWHPDAITGLNPETGAVLWTHPYPVGGKPQRPEVAIAMPRVDGNRLFLTSFYQGSLLLEVPAEGHVPRLLWNRRTTQQSDMTEGLHTVMSTPILSQDFIYGFCAFGELRCLQISSGDRVWESLDIFGGKGGFFAHSFIIPQNDRHWFWNDQGELALGRLSHKGLEIISKASILQPTESTRGRDVLWCHPAFADRKMWVHNGKELVCLDLAAKS